MESKTTTHLLTLEDRIISFTAGAIPDTIVISEGEQVAHASTQLARDFYGSLIAKGWQDPDDIEAEMHRIEAEGDREQTRRDEENKHVARSRSERMARAMRGAN